MLLQDLFITIKMTETQNQILNSSPTFKLHVFRASVGERTVVYQVVKMLDSVFVFVNFSNDFRLVDMSLAIQSPYEKEPIGTQLLGDHPESITKSIAARLCKRLNKSAYLSWNVDCEKGTASLIERRLHEEINKSADCF